jgi:Caspase domain
MFRRALVVGIDDYPHAPLESCVKDAKRMAQLLERHEDGTPNFAVKLMTTPPSVITRVTLRQAIRELLEDGADLALLYFSGHGTENNLGGFLVTPDAAVYDEGVALTEVLTLANTSAAREVVVLLDCCHAGSLGVVPPISNEVAALREGVSILTASRAGQAAMEHRDGGVFTSLVLAALEGGAADAVGAVTAASVYAYVDESLGPWDQRPLLKSHVSQLVPLRYARPSIDIAILRELPAWFSSDEADLPLDPSYEPEAEPRDAEHERVFHCLQQARAAKLVEPVGTQHMYYAAMEHRSCRLTALGRHYWHLAYERKI